MNRDISEKEQDYKGSAENMNIYQNSEDEHVKQSCNIVGNKYSQKRN